MSSLSARIENWPIAGRFTISRGSRTEVTVVVAEVTNGHHTGKGEGVPYARYGETPETVLQILTALEGQVRAGLTRDDLQTLLSAGAARNALDCALWDLEAKATATPAFRLAGLDRLDPVITAYTLSLETPERMARAASLNAHRPLLKLKLGGGPQDLERLEAVRAAAPSSRLIIDANEGWHGEALPVFMQACARADVALIEQPLPAKDDDALRTCPRPVPVCADESVHDRRTLAALRGKYDAVNIKLDKTGGLTEALHLAKDAHAQGFQIMIGCMLGTSLGMAPAVILAQTADFVDLDGPLLLAKDRTPGLTYDGSTLLPPSATVWG